MTQVEPYTGRPDKERLIAAMRGQEIDRAPNFEVLIEEAQDVRPMWLTRARKIFEPIVSSTIFPTRIL